MALERQEVTRAFLYQQIIDKTIFDGEVQRIGAELRGIEGRLSDLETGLGDIDGLLQFAEGLLSAPDRWWTESEPQYRAMLQQVFFPNGLPYGPDGFGTAETCPFFGLKEGLRLEIERLASPAGFEPAFWP